MCAERSWSTFSGDNLETSCSRGGVLSTQLLPTWHLDLVQACVTLVVAQAMLRLSFQKGKLAPKLSRPEYSGPPPPFAERSWHEQKYFLRYDLSCLATRPSRTQLVTS